MLGRHPCKVPLPVWISRFSGAAPFPFKSPPPILLAEGRQPGHQVISRSVPARQASASLPGCRPSSDLQAETMSQDWLSTIEEQFPGWGQDFRRVVNAACSGLNPDDRDDIFQKVALSFC